jgi:hypothetical protein
MKTWAAVAAFVALIGAVVGAGLLSARAQAQAEGLTATLTKAERKAKRPPPPAPSATPATEPQALALDDLPTTLRFRQTNTYNGNVVFVPETCQGQYDVILHFHGAHPYVKELVEKAAVAAVVTVFNSGNGAERYAQAFGAGGMLSSIKRQVDAATARCVAARAPSPGASRSRPGAPAMARSKSF